MGANERIAWFALLGVLLMGSCAEGHADDDDAHSDDSVDTGTGDAAKPDPPVSGANTARFFLSGHSLTDDPTADDVVTIARSLGLTAEYEEQIVIGSPIRYRTKGPDVNAAGFPGYHLGKNREGFDMDVLAELSSPRNIAAGTRYDTLVITERNDLPMVVRWENTVGYLRHFHDRVVAANPEARTLLFASWLAIRSEGAAYTTADWIAYEKAALDGWACVAAKVNLTLEAEGRDDRIVVLPASGALVALVERVLAGEVPGIVGTTDERLHVLFRDSVHLTLVGKYFMGLVTVTALYGRSPVGAHAPAELGLDAATVAALQETAAAYVIDYYAAHAAPPSMPACRALFAEQLCAPFAVIAATNDAAACATVYSDESAEENPFRWPDPGFQPLPAP